MAHAKQAETGTWQHVINSQMGQKYKQTNFYRRIMILSTFSAGQWATLKLEPSADLKYFCTSHL